MNSLMTFANLVYSDIYYVCGRPVWSFRRIGLRHLQADHEPLTFVMISAGVFCLIYI